MDVREFCLPIPPLVRWRAECSARRDALLDGLSADAPEGARSIRLFVKPYAPFALEAGKPALSAFYLASQSLYESVRASCERPAFRLPLKPILAGYGIGARGRNSLISLAGMGTYFAVEAAWSAEEAPPRPWTEEPPLAEECQGCDRCLRACPAGALDGEGHVDTSRCLRALAAKNAPPMPEAAMAMTGASLWGCDLCQLACPRNAGIVPIPMPEEVRGAISLSRLLAGDTRDLAPLIGTNYARKARMRIRACLVAACLQKKEYLDAVRALEGDPLVGPYARWAARRLEEDVQDGAGNSWKQ